MILDRLLESMRTRLCVYLLALLAYPASAIPLCQSQSEQMKFWGGTLLQILSFHAGSGTDFYTTQSVPQSNPHATQTHSDIIPTKAAFSALVGASAGVMYMNPEDDRDFDYGWRLRYLYNYTPQNSRQTHHIGGVLYLHPFPNPYHRFIGAIQTHTDCENKPDGYPTPFSLLIGSGLSAQNAPLGSSIGGYVEVGLALFKWFPINAELVYRANFYPNNPYHIEPITHNLQIILAIL